VREEFAFGGAIVEPPSAGGQFRAASGSRLKLDGEGSEFKLELVSAGSKPKLGL